MGLPCAGCTRLFLALPPGCAEADRPPALDRAPCPLWPATLPQSPADQGWGRGTSPHESLSLGHLIFSG